jgi:hypothetical protein
LSYDLNSLKNKQSQNPQQSQQSQQILSKDVNVDQQPQQNVLYQTALDNILQINNQLNDLQNHELKDLATRIEKLEKCCNEKGKGNEKEKEKVKKCDKKKD